MRHSFLMAAATAFMAVSSNSTFAQYSHRHWRRQACAMSRTFGGRHFVNVEKLRVFPLLQNTQCISLRDCWRKDAPWTLLTSFLSGRGVAISSKTLVADASAVRSRLTGFHLMSCFFTVRLLTPSSELRFRKEQVHFTTSNSTRRVLCLSLMFGLSDGTRSR